MKVGLEQPQWVSVLAGGRARVEAAAVNYLAHLLLAGPGDASRVGNLLGDFVRGTPDSLRELYPVAVVEGIVMHRKLDRFTDDHPAFREARALLAPQNRRFAGILIDIFFDHFLTQHWPTFAEGEVAEFTEEVFQVLERHPEWLSEELRRVLPRMRRENWLQSYGTLSGIELTLQRVAARSARLAPLAFAAGGLTDHYHSLDRLFHRFFPDAQARAAEILERGE